MNKSNTADWEREQVARDQISDEPLPGDWNDA